MSESAPVPVPAGAGGERPAVLVINPDLPKYGSRFHEFTNTVGLAGAFHVGLVTQLSETADWLHVRRLEAEGVAVYPFDGIPGPPAPGDGIPGPPAPGDGVQGPAVPGPGVRGRGAPLAFLRRVLRFAAGLVNLARPWPAEIYVNRRTLANLAGPLRRALAERRWDRVVIVQSSFAEWIDRLPASVPAVLVLHDVRTMVFRRRAEVAEGWPAVLAARLTAARYRAFEAAYLPRFAAVVCLTGVDAGLVQRWFGLPPDRVPVVPLPVDPEYFRPGPPPGAAPALMFPGMMNHRPNIDGALWFVRAVLPLVRARHPGVRFVIAGMNPPPEIAALDGRDGVRVTGTVPDMRPLFLEAAVVVVPLRIGSGARNKILEAWACGRPVVSTPVGAEGLAVADGGNLRLAGDAAAFAAAVSDLLERPDDGRRLIEGGFAALASHTPDRVAPLYRAAVAAAGAARPAAAGRPLHAVLDLRWMIPGSAGGLEQHARALVDTLLGLDRWNRYTLILPVECVADFDLRHRDTVRVICRDGPAADLGRAARLAGGLIGRRLGGSAVRWPELWALGDRARLDADVVYSFNGIHPELWHHPRHVVMVPDIQHEYLPGFFPAATVAERRNRLEGALARAAGLCVISDFTRATLVERLGVAPERITVTPLAAAPAFRPAAPGEDVAGALARRFGLAAGGYLFLPAHTWPHKNHRTVIAALARLRAAGRPVPVLACSGGDRQARPALEALIAESGLGDRVRFLGYRPAGDIRLLYQGALALVFPSLFEGFGMPVVEAMACGCPVICAAATSLPEVAGDAALLVGSEDAEAWAAAIGRLAAEPELRAGLIRRGFVQAARFTWRRHALGTLEALRAAAGPPATGRD